MNLTRHPDAGALEQAVATELADIIRHAIDGHGRARLALAGGSTPMPVYRALARQPLDWLRVSLLPGDERWVAHDHEACNFTAMRAAFGTRPADFRPLTPARPGPEPDLAAARESLAAIDGQLGGQFDACLLGMGADGHFASLFPGAAELETALDPEHPDPLVVVHPDPLPPEAPFARISLTLSAILSSSSLIMAIRGEAKLNTLEQAQASGDARRFPVCALLAQAGDRLKIHWSP